MSYRAIRVLTVLFVAILLSCGTASAQVRRAQLSDTLEIKEWSPSPAGAAFRSLLFPGWGQAYVRHPLKAVIYGGIEQALIYNIYRSHHQYVYFDSKDGFELNAASHKDNRNRLSWYLAGAVILSMMDAYVDAHLYHFNVSDKLSSREGFMGSGVIVTVGWRTP